MADQRSRIRRRRKQASRSSNRARWLALIFGAVAATAVTGDQPVTSSV
jgi:hypothetical protein